MPQKDDKVAANSAMEEETSSTSAEPGVDAQLPAKNAQPAGSKPQPVSSESMDVDGDVSLTSGEMDAEPEDEESPITLSEEQRALLSSNNIDPDLMQKFASAYAGAHKLSEHDAEQLQHLGAIAEVMKQMRNTIMSESQKAKMLEAELKKARDRVATQEVERFRASVDAARNAAEHCEMARENARISQMTDEDWGLLCKAYEVLPEGGLRKAYGKSIDFMMLNSKSTESQICEARAQIERRPMNKAAREERIRTLDELLSIHVTGPSATSMLCATETETPSNLFASLTSPRPSFMAANSADHPSRRFAGFAGQKTKREESPDEPAARQNKKTPTFLDGLFAEVAAMKGK